MSKRRGGLIGVNPSPAASGISSSAGGIWSLPEAESLKRAGTWPSAPYWHDNLTARWCPSLDSSGNGTTTVYNIDKSGNQIGSGNFTLTNMDAATDWVADTVSGGVRAIDFDGSNDYLTGSTTLGNFGTADFSICLWAKLPNSDAYASIVSKRQTSGSFQQWQLNHGTGSAAGGTASKRISWVAYTGTWQIYYTSTDVADGNWHHIAVTKTSGSAPLIYVDGVAAAVTVGSANTTNLNTNSTTALEVGRVNADVQYASMRWDDMMLFSVAKSAGDIATIAAARGILAT